jgi:hypothetical protein
MLKYTHPINRLATNLVPTQRAADNLCVLHELHEYDQDEDSSKALVPHGLLSHNVFTFRKVLVAIERLGGLFQRTDIWLRWLFC